MRIVLRGVRALARGELGMRLNPLHSLAWVPGGLLRVLRHGRKGVYDFVVALAECKRR